MRKIFLGVLFLPLCVVAQAAPGGVVFTSKPQTIGAGAMSDTLTIQTQDSDGNAFKLPQTGCLALSSSSLAGEFSSSASNWEPVSVLTMNKNSANRNFYYKNSLAGTQTLTAKAVLKPEGASRSCAIWPTAEWPTGWTATQAIVVGGEGAPTSPTADSTGDTSVVATPPSILSEKTALPIPTLSVVATAPARVTTGADVVLSATVFGAQKEPIQNARVLWNFGNGASREGASVHYAYNIPGTYLVVVSAASGGLSGMARFKVTASAPAVRVSDIEAGPAGFIEIENTGAMELDLSGWILGSGSLQFGLPPHTTLLPKTKVAFPASATGVFIVVGDARLLFPNGTEAARYEENISLPKKESENPPPVPTPFLKDGVRGGFSATTTPASLALSLVDDTPTPLWLWLGGVLGIGVVGVGALAAFRFRTAAKGERSEAERFAASVHIDTA